jgi:hypothetical protein
MTVVVLDGLSEYPAEKVMLRLISLGQRFPAP